MRGMRKWLSRLGNRRRGSGGLRSAGDGARGLTVVMMGCGVSLEGNWGGEIDAAVTAKLATASGHIVLLVLARPAGWTGGRPEDCSPRTSPAEAVTWAISTQTLSVACRLD